MATFFQKSKENKTETMEQACVELLNQIKKLDTTMEVTVYGPTYGSNGDWATSEPITFKNIRKINHSFEETIKSIQNNSRLDDEQKEQSYRQAIAKLSEDCMNLQRKQMVDFMFMKPIWTTTVIGGILLASGAGIASGLYMNQLVDVSSAANGGIAFGVSVAALIIGMMLIRELCRKFYTPDPNSDSENQLLDEYKKELNTWNTLQEDEYYEPWESSEEKQLLNLMDVAIKSDAFKKYLESEPGSTIFGNAREERPPETNPQYLS